MEEIEYIDELSKNYLENVKIKEYPIPTSGPFFKEKREKTGIKAAWIAYYIGIDPTNFCKWEAGERNFKNEKRLRLISEALELIPEMKVKDLMKLIKDATKNARTDTGEI